MNVLFDHFATHALEDTALTTLAITAVVSTMTHPDKFAKMLGAGEDTWWARFAQWPAELYRWFYEATQAFWSARNPHPPPNPITPAEPARKA